MNNDHLRGHTFPFVVLPLSTDRGLPGPIPGPGRILLNSLSQLTLALTGVRPVLIAYQAATRSLFNLGDPSSSKSGDSPWPIHCSLESLPWMERWQAVAAGIGSWPDWLVRWSGRSPGRSRGKTAAVFMNASFLISERPPYLALTTSALSRGYACCGNRNTGDLFGFAMRLLPGTEDKLSRLLNWLTATRGEQLSFSPETAAELELPPAQAGPWNSPAMRTSRLWQGFRPNDAPPYLNAALEEICFTPASSSGKIDSQGSVAAAFTAHRERSRVPWVFNELLNEIDYRTGAPLPGSFPPELHISLTGNCNIECAFCSRTTKGYAEDFVRLGDIRKLDFLHSLRTLRLSSGSGEPTLNRALPTIIRWIHHHHPHLGMNFFTNGIHLNRDDLALALIHGQVSWINVSINAATRESWGRLCNADYFSQVCRNLRHLRDLKLQLNLGNPNVHGSMVLTPDTVQELPLMPTLCKELGIDRFVAIPFFGLRYDRPGKNGEELAYHNSSALYDAIYHRTVENARVNGVSVELPRPRDQKCAAFAVESRILHDFAGIERHEWQLGKLLCSYPFSRPEGSYCSSLWRCAAATGAMGGLNGEMRRWLYPCLGPLATVMMAKKLAFEFPGGSGFLKLWQSALLRFLRESQHQPGLCAVCDGCRNCDTRQPHVVRDMTRLVAEFEAQNGL
jgi:MoaA/NifB/PqqE/SkfB family radical SAM enzyme